MTKEELLRILEKYRNGTASPEEKEISNRFLANREKHWIDDWSDMEASEKDKMRVEMFESILKKVEVQTGMVKRPKRAIWHVAAMFALFMGIAWFFVSNDAQQPSQVSYITKIAARGQKLTVTLSDGSMVKLNSESSITFPESFADADTRTIQLVGEAFFEVTRDEAKPFKISTDSLITTVLGTSFNVRAYPEDVSISVTVATGKVLIQPRNPKEDERSQRSHAILTPGQQGLFNKQSASITKSTVDPDKYLAWRHNLIRFDRIPLSEAVEILERWYDVEIELENEIGRTCLIEGSYQNESLANVLESMQFAGRLEYEFVNKRKIKISGNACNN
ncbi:FecR domain-containing protein [Fulvivirgaceae bacterium BMA10]|uniref:FecR domain-containing protein n=1 Tax=Splendidivirga corallicola TaxID=3051826 RepID=A0ABT8KLS7_9BACT|nr:FecR domain-containing protein [Fulvivirgaceae bacterium BMA10]